MNKEVAHKLEDAIIECGNNFSRNDREHNHNNEDFINGRRVANSGNAALVLYDKVPGNKVALFNFYYLRNAKRNGVTGYWVYFASSYEMLPIFKLTEQWLLNVEDLNYEKNFIGGNNGLKHNL